MGKVKTFDSNQDCFYRQIAMNRVLELEWNTKERSFVQNFSGNNFGPRHFLGQPLKTFLGKTSISGKATHLCPYQLKFDMKEEISVSWAKTGLDPIY